ncbi:glycosyltransferase [Flavobacterium sp. ZB4R12]|uniref:glycosyltransferase n=1 Tax=Flavobacterium sp. ZB4R12 TaxID=3398732 RepID=UPI003AABF718
MKSKLFLYRIKRFLINSFSLLDWRVRFIFFYFYNPIFNKIVKEQNLDLKKIPIIIINFNQLEYLKKLIDFLVKNDYENIVVIDNNSTYPPLLNYYEKINDLANVIKMKTNQGHRVFWKNKGLYQIYGKGYYVISDSDIEPNDNCPKDFLLHFKKILDKNKNVIKVGFSLRINDIPDSNKHKSKILNWEKQFWDKKDRNDNYISEIDTTFALYRPINQFNLKFFYKAIRTKSPYIAKHGGWYIDHENLTEEQDFYMKTANGSSSWKVDNKGEVLEGMYKQYLK